jgi:hypothetical protein
MNKTKADKVNVYAYLTPDPLDDDSTLETEWMEWIPGFNAQEDEDGSHPFFRDENIALFKAIELTTVSHFRKSLRNLSVLLTNHLFDHIQIAIDHLGIVSRDTSVASYDYGNSQPEMGKYVMHASRSLMSAYIKAGHDLTKLSPYTAVTWEHEIIHLLDHWEVVKSCVYKSSALAINKFTYYLLSYRNEGLADLFYLLNGRYHEVNSIEAAKTAFDSAVQRVQHKMLEKDMTDDEWNQEIFSEMDCYEAGPWLMLDLLRSFEGCWHERLIDEALLQITKREPLSHLKTLYIIRIALRVKTEDFLDYIMPLVPKYKQTVHAELLDQLVLN